MTSEQFNEIATTHREGLVRLAESKLGCKAMAEAVVQDAILKMAEIYTATVLTGPGHDWRWMSTIVKNLCVDYQRSRSKYGSSCHQGIADGLRTKEKLLKQRQK